MTIIYFHHFFPNIFYLYNYFNDEVNMKITISDNKLIVYPSFFLLIVMMLCSEKPSSPVIARVGKSILTVDDFNKSIPAEYSEQITLKQNINYVKQWIDTELLFQDALRKKIDREPAIKERLEKMKKDLLAAEIMNRFSLQEPKSTINDKAIRNYYELNKEKFIREKDVAKYLEIVTSDLRTAWYISKNATEDNFITLAEEYSQQTYPENNNVPYIALEDIQPEIRRAIFSISINVISNPIKSEIGYHVIRVLDKLEKGGICKEEEIWEDIINQLTVKTQKENMEQHLADLRLKTNVEFNSEHIKSGKLTPSGTSK